MSGRILKATPPIACCGIYETSVGVCQPRPPGSSALRLSCTHLSGYPSSHLHRDDTYITYVKFYKSIRIDKCGLQPGLCEGSIVLAQKEGREATLDVRVGTWVKQGDDFLTIDELRVSDRVKAQTFRISGQAAPRVAILEFTEP